MYTLHTQTQNLRFPLSKGPLSGSMPRSFRFLLPRGEKKSAKAQNKEAQRGFEDQPDCRLFLRILRSKNIRRGKKREASTTISPSYALDPAPLFVESRAENEGKSWVSLTSKPSSTQNKGGNHSSINDRTECKMCSTVSSSGRMRRRSVHNWHVRILGRATRISL